MTGHQVSLRADDDLGGDVVPNIPADPLDTPLPKGVALRALPEGGDDVERTTAVYRDDWQLEIARVQWNLVSSKPNTLRGVHVHLDHWDYVHVISGEMLLRLHDLWSKSPSYRLSAQRRLARERPVSIAIPPDVAHGFYFASSTTYFYALSHYWTPLDDLGCRWNDPELGLTWPTSDPLLSARDDVAPGYKDLAKAVAAAFEQGIEQP